MIIVLWDGVITWFSYINKYNLLVKCQFCPWRYRASLPVGCQVQFRSKGRLVIAEKCQFLLTSGLFY